MSIMITAMVSSCVGPPQAGRIKSPAAQTAAFKTCLSDLSRLSARYEIVANQTAAPGCATPQSVKLSSVGIPISNVTAIQCPLARTLATWAQTSAQPAARTWLGHRIVRIESFGAYACRNVIGRPSAGSKRSEHATANAVDIGAFILADGRRVSVKDGWSGTPGEREFLRAVRGAACRQFSTVLSPDYNAAHHDHLHFDMGRGPFCR